jgi:peptidoglycan hydrolase-like protein with peptidoglycan-binding domain
MILGFLTLITALAISAVAIYYSVAGLAAIFAAAVIPIVIMGGTLEIAKLVTAVWLHKYWHKATWWLKSYLAFSVVVLMFITSMGIFGFLSKAHIEQTSASEESVARIQTIEEEIARQMAIVGRAENRIRQLEGSETGADASVQAQIDKEKERIDNAYKRIQPIVDEQQKIIDSQGKIFRDELARLDERLATLQGYIDAGGRENIQRAQQMVGARADGAFGPNTAQAFRDWQAEQQTKRTDLLTRIEQASNNPQARAARNEIQRLRRTVEAEIAESNKVINRLRSQIGTQNNTSDIQKEIDEQNDRIRTASSEVDKLNEERITLQAEYRKLEAEVGPIKYIAEFIYGESADKSLLEEAVRWVIIIIIFVFDPLAVLLLIASQYTFNWYRQEKETKENSNDVRTDGTTTKTDQKDDAEQHDDVGEPRTESDISNDATTGHRVEQTEVQPDGLTPDEIARPYSEIDKPSNEEISLLAESNESAIEESVEKKDIESLEGSDRLTEEQLKELDDDPHWSEAKRSWKEENPTLTIKETKEKYLEGKIDKLPWEDYLPTEKKTYIMKTEDRQVKKETKPESSENTPQSGYIQNEEQSSESALWKRIKDSGK